MKTEPYALVTDGSDEKGLTETNPLTVQYFDTAKQKVSTPLLDICGTKKIAAEALFNKIDKVLSNVVVSWDNCGINSVQTTQL